MLFAATHVAAFPNWVWEHDRQTYHKTNGWNLKMEPYQDKNPDRDSWLDSENGGPLKKDIPLGNHSFDVYILLSCLAICCFSFDAGCGIVATSPEGLFPCRFLTIFNVTQNGWTFEPLNFEPPVVVMINPMSMGGWNTDSSHEFLGTLTGTVDGWNLKQPPGMVLKPYK